MLGTKTANRFLLMESSDGDHRQSCQHLAVVVEWYHLDHTLVPLPLRVRGGNLSSAW